MHHRPGAPPPGGAPHGAAGAPPHGAHPPHRPGTVVRRTASRRMASRTLSPTAITAAARLKRRHCWWRRPPGTGPHSQAGSDAAEVSRARAAARRRYRQPPADIPSEACCTHAIPRRTEPPAAAGRRPSPSAGATTGSCSRAPGISGCDWFAAVRSAAEALGEQLIAGQPHDAGELLRVARAGKQRHGATLRKTGQHDARAGDAARVLAADERGDRGL